MTALEALQSQPYAVTVAQAAALMGVKPATARAALDKLAEQRKAVRCILPLKRWPENAEYRVVGRSYATVNYEFSERWAAAQKRTREEMIRDAASARRQ